MWCAKTSEWCVQIRDTFKGSALPDIFLGIARVHSGKKEYTAACSVLREGIARHPACAELKLLWADLTAMHIYPTLDEEETQKATFDQVKQALEDAKDGPRGVELPHTHAWTTDALFRSCVHCSLGKLYLQCSAVANEVLWNAKFHFKEAHALDVDNIQVR